MIRFACPDCDTVLETADNKAGTLTTCPDCGTRMQVPGAAPKDTAVSSRPSSGGPKLAPKKRPRRRDDDEDDDRPRKGGGAGPWLLVGGGVVAVLVVAGVVLAFALNGSGGKSDSGAQANNAGGANTPAETGKGPGDPGKKPDNPKEPDDDKLPDLPDSKPRTLSREQINKRLLKSTVWIVCVRNGRPVSSGSGSLIDRTNGILLTNYHVVHDSPQDLVVFFPLYDQGNTLISETEKYIEKAKNGQYLRGKSVVEDKNRDLALVQLQSRVPDGNLALRFAAKEPAQGAEVHSLGSPGGSLALWLYTPGNVRTVYQKKWESGSQDGSLLMKHNARVIETNSPINPGDSGGPLVNDRAELIGVTQSVAVDVNSISTFIAGSEARDLIEKYFKSAGKQWVHETTEPDLGGGSEITVDVITKLIKGLKHKDPLKRAEAAEKLGLLGARSHSAVPDLMQALKDPDDLVRRMSIDALNKVGTPSKTDVPRLVEALKDSVPEVRLYAVGALANMGPDARGAVPALLDVAKDAGNAEMRRQAIVALGKAGGQDRDKVFGPLFGLLKDSSKEVRTLAFDALFGLGKPSAAELSVLTQALTDAQPEVRLYAARAIGLLGPEAKDAVAVLGQVLQGADKQTAAAAAESLGKVGDEAKPAVPGLVRALQDGDPGLSKAAGEALGLLPALAKAEVLSLTEALKSPKAHVRANALKVLAQIGPDAKDALPAVAEALKDAAKAVRVQAALALGAFAPGSKEAVPKLTEALKEGDVELRRAAIDSLAKYGPAAKEALAALDPLLKDKELMGAAIQAVSAIGPNTQALRTMFGLLDENKAVAPLIFAAFTKAGRPAVGYLAQVLRKDPQDKQYLLAAAKALGEIGPEVEKAEPKAKTEALNLLAYRATRDTDPEVKQACEAAYKKIKAK